MNVKSKILKIRNLPCNETRLDTISSKPYAFICVILALGILLLCSSYYLIGAVVSIFSAYYLLAVKNVKLVEFYENYAVFYLNNGKEECFVMFWEDVAQWEISGNRMDLDTLNVMLKNNQSISIRCVQRKKIEKFFQMHTCLKKTNAVTKQHA